MKDVYIQTLIVYFVVSLPTWRIIMIVFGIIDVTEELRSKESFKSQSGHKQNYTNKPVCQKKEIYKVMSLFVRIVLL